MSKQIYNAIDSKLNTLIGFIKDNQNIKRCLTYMSDTPLLKNISQPDISTSLLNNKIVLDFFDAQILDEAGCKMHIYHVNSDFTDNYLSNIYICIDIICNSNFWRLKGQQSYRWNLIMSEIEDIFNFQSINSVGKIRILNTETNHLTGTNYNIAHSVLKITTQTK